MSGKNKNYQKDVIESVNQGKMFVTKMYGKIVLAAVGFLLTMVAPASADTLQNVVYTELKNLFQPLLDTLVFPVLPFVAALGLVAAAAAPVVSHENGEEAKKKISSVVTWIIVAEVILAAFWVIMKLFAMVGGKEVTV